MTSSRRNNAADRPSVTFPTTERKRGGIFPSGLRCPLLQSELDRGAELFALQVWPLLRETLLGETIVVRCLLHFVRGRQRIGQLKLDPG